MCSSGKPDFIINIIITPSFKANVVKHTRKKKKSLLKSGDAGGDEEAGCASICTPEPVKQGRLTTFVPTNASIGTNSVFSSPDKEDGSGEESGHAAPRDEDEDEDEEEGVCA
jgi:hypothetical protein